MTTIVESAVSAAPETIRQRMIAMVRRAVASPSLSGVRRVELQVSGVTPLVWLAAQPVTVKGYWSDRDGTGEVSAAGEADEVKGNEAVDYHKVFGQLRERLGNCGDDVRFYGGFRFGGWHPADQSWRPFGSYRFILPQLEVVRRGDDTFLACNIARLNPDNFADNAIRQLESMVWPGERRETRLPPPLGRRDDPPEQGWREQVDAVLRMIEAGKLSKLVLARRSCFEFGQSLDAFGLLRQLKEGTPGCFHFCGNHGGVVAFMGASPERLYRRDGSKVLSEAVAGTRPRGETADGDEVLARELLHSAKDIAEHRFVLDSVKAALAPICASGPWAGDVGILKVSGVQHLIARVEGTLRSDAGDADILQRLHPTPAVGGHPTSEALQEIRRLESFDRGWYAAPVGWVAREAAEFAVAIRCGAMGGSRLCLFSGAGIVKGSEPDAEWREIENKIGNFLNVLTGP